MIKNIENWKLALINIFVWIVIIILMPYLNYFIVMPFFVINLFYFKNIRHKLVKENIFKHEFLNNLLKNIDFTFLFPFEVFKYRIEKNKDNINNCYEEKNIFEDFKKNDLIYPFLQPFSMIYDVLSSAFSRFSVIDFSFLKTWIFHVISCYLITLIVMYIGKTSLMSYLLLYVYPAAVFYNYINLLIAKNHIKKDSHIFNLINLVK